MGTGSSRVGVDSPVQPDEIRIAVKASNKITKQLDIDTNTPESELEKKELRNQIKNSLSKLPDKLRIAIVLRDIQGFSYEEISQHLSCSAGTVKSRINRARQKLKEILKNKELFTKNFVNNNEGRDKGEKM